MLQSTYKHTKQQDKLVKKGGLALARLTGDCGVKMHME